MAAAAAAVASGDGGQENGDVNSVGGAGLNKRPKHGPAEGGGTEDGSDKAHVHSGENGDGGVGAPGGPDEVGPGDNKGEKTQQQQCSGGGAGEPGVEGSSASLSLPLPSNGTTPEANGKYGGGEGVGKGEEGVRAGGEEEEGRSCGNGTPAEGSKKKRKKKKKKRAADGGVAGAGAMGEESRVAGHATDSPEQTAAATATSVVVAGKRCREESTSTTTDAADEPSTAPAASSSNDFKKRKSEEGLDGGGGDRNTPVTAAVGIKGPAVDGAATTVTVNGAEAVTDGVANDHADENFMVEEGGAAPAGAAALSSAENGGFETPASADSHATQEVRREGGLTFFFFSRGVVRVFHGAPLVRRCRCCGSGFVGVLCGVSDARGHVTEQADIEGVTRGSS